MLSAMSEEAETCETGGEERKRSGKRCFGRNAISTELNFSTQARERAVVAGQCLRVIINHQETQRGVSRANLTV